MATRVHQAFQYIDAPPSAVYGAFASAKALESWLPPKGMTGRILAFDFREGGGYRMALVDEGPKHASGKTSQQEHEVEVRIRGLIPERRITQEVTFVSDDPQFAGVMKIVWTFTTDEDGAYAGVRCENVPPGVQREEHEAGLRSSLANLADFVERSTHGKRRDVKPRIQVWGGVAIEGDPTSGGVTCCIVDRNTGVQIVDDMFRSKAEAQAYLDEHREEIVGRGLPPVDPDVLAELLEALPKLEAKFEAGGMTADDAESAAKLLSRLGKRVTDLSMRQRIDSLVERLTARPPRRFPSA